MVKQVRTEKRNIKKWELAMKIVQWSRACLAVVEDPGLFPCTQIVITVIYNSNFSIQEIPSFEYYRKRVVHSMQVKIINIKPNKNIELLK